MQEDKESKINLPDDDPQVVGAMMHYLYNFDYSDYGIAQSDVDAIVLDVRMFAIADKYSIKPLKQLAAKKFAQRCKDEWDTPAFADAVSEAYDTAPEMDDSLERTIITTVKIHAKDIRRRASESSEFKLSKVMRSIPNLGAGLFFTRTDKPTREEEKMNWYQCPGTSCQGQAAFFCISKSVSPNAAISCPMRCYPNQNGQWWNSYITTKPSEPSAEDDDDDD